MCAEHKHKYTHYCTRIATDWCTVWRFLRLEPRVKRSCTQFPYALRSRNFERRKAVDEEEEGLRVTP